MGYTLHKLLEENTVKVPLIQRDYAQGRSSEEKVRNDFIDKIKSTLESENKNLNLDFIYGYTTSNASGNSNFIPLDGQQRLTTLWLIHWYSAIKEELLNNGGKENVDDLLLNFTYETRVSSKRFCEKLVKHPIIFNAETKSLKEKIVDAPWFMSSWINDPTIIAMLNMIDTIHSRMYQCKNVWNKLIRENQITFDYIDIKSEEFKLTDELYIKMNSRGKPLTPFENFKAIFSQVLNDETTDFYHERIKYKGSKISYQQYFSFRVDGKWTDLFWDYKEMRDKLDENFLNFFYYIAEMLHYKTNKEDAFERNFNSLEIVFAKKANVDFLFDSLDLLVNIGNIKQFFNEIFSVNDYLFGKVKLFGENSTDLFHKSFTNTSFDVLQRVLFYAILKFLIDTNSGQVNEDLINFTRIVRNMLLRVRQINTSKRIEIISNLRLPNFNDYVKFIDAFINEIVKNKYKVLQVFVNNNFKGFTSDSFSLEREKINYIIDNPALVDNIFRLEDHDEVRGVPDNFAFDKQDFSKKVDAFYKIWSFKENNNSQLVRALLTFGDFSVITHDYSKLGEIWFFGTEGYWNRIIAPLSEDEKLKTKTILNDFLSNYISSEKITTSEKLYEMINNYQAEEKDWRYYFINYKEITSAHHQKNNVFTWDSEDSFNINSLGNSGKQPLASYHLNPYLITIKERVNKVKAIEHYLGRYSDELSHLSLDGEVEIYGGYGCFEIYNLIDKDHQDLIKEFNLEKADYCHLLYELKNKDLIETATLFCKSFLQSNN